MNLQFVTPKKWAEMSGADPGWVSHLEECAQDGSIESIALCGGDEILIDIKNIENWLRHWFYTPTSTQTEAENPSGKIIERICNLAEDLGHRFKIQRRYINLRARSSSNRVYGQIHKPKDKRKYPGIFLVFPNGFLHPCGQPYLSDATIGEIEGDYGPNSSWLRGDSKRGTTVKATIYFLPFAVAEYEESDSEWQSLSTLLQEAQKARE